MAGLGLEPTTPGFLGTVYQNTLPLYLEKSNPICCILNHLQFMIGSSCVSNFAFLNTVMILRFQTDSSGQTVRPRSNLIRIYTVCHYVCIFWTHYPVVKWSCSNFRIFRVSRFLWYNLFSGLGFSSLHECNRHQTAGPQHSSYQIQYTEVSEEGELERPHHRYFTHISFNVLMNTKTLVTSLSHATAVPFSFLPLEKFCLSNERLSPSVR